MQKCITNTQNSVFVIKGYKFVAQEIRPRGLGWEGFTVLVSDPQQVCCLTNRSITHTQPIGDWRRIPKSMAKRALLTSTYSGSQQPDGSLASVPGWGMTPQALVRLLLLHPGIY